MINSAIDPADAVCGCILLMGTALAIRQGVRLLQRIRRLNQPEQTVARQQAFLRVLIVLVGLSGVVASSTLPFDLALYKGLTATQRLWRETLNVALVVSLVVLVVGWSCLGSIAKRIDAVQVRDDESSA